MRVLTEIDEKDYKDTLDGCFNITAFQDAIRYHSTPLPEHHGDLKDANNIIELLVSRKYGKNVDSDDIVKGYNLGIDAAIRLIRHIDTVIPATEPPHWIERRLRMGIHDWTCSVCKCQCEETAKICPTCGTNTDGRYTMEGESE